MSQNVRLLERGPIGIASSCLTADISTLKSLLKPLKASTSRKFLGWITLKSMDSGTGKPSAAVAPNSARIVHMESPYGTPLLPGSLICRGKNEWLTEENAAQLSKDLRKLLRELQLNVGIKLSLPMAVWPSKYPEVLRLLYRDHGAEFDAIELPLKYLVKPILADIPDLLSLKYLHDATMEQYGTALAVLFNLRKGLLELDLEHVSIHLKLSVDNLNPEVMAALLLAPGSGRMRPLLNDLKEYIRPSLSAAAQGSFDEQIFERGADTVVLFDSEKMPVFPPDPDSDFRSAMIPKAEGGYCIKGGALAGKAIAKDSLKYLYRVAAHMVTCRQDPEYLLVSSGGCDSGIDAAGRLALGATGVELCTVLLREGSSGLRRILDEFEQAVGDTRNWRSLIGAARLNFATEEIYIEPEFTLDKNRCKACGAGTCRAVCWRTGQSRKKLKRWPPASCTLCGSCVTLCMGGGTLWS